MMKKRLHTRGFTLAEILITLVIVGFIGALGVPMLGQQKMNKPEYPKTNHGVFECYYGADGQLHQFKADNSNRNSMLGTDTIVADYCSFSPPIANFYTIQVIGAGGHGGLYDTGTNPYYNTIVVAGDTGTVSAGTSFRADLDAAPEWVREKWDNQWANGATPTTYTLESPLGSSGDTVCQYARKGAGILGEAAAAKCALDCASITPTCIAEHPECLDRQIGQGGDSGYGGSYRVTVKLKHNYDVNIQETISSASVSFGEGGSVSIASSGSGTDGRKLDDLNVKDGTNGSSVTSSSVSSTIAGTFSTSSRRNTAPNTCSGTSSEAAGESADSGSVNISGTTSYDYESQALAIQSMFGYRGEPGNVTSRVVSKLPESALRLYPARDRNSNSIVQISAGGGYKNFLISEPGDNGEVHALGTEDIAIEGIEATDFPFPRALYPAAFESKNAQIPLFTASGYKSKFPDLIADPKLSPGRSGMGAYPVLSIVSGTPYYKINGVSVNSNPTTHDYSASAATYTCMSGEAPLTDASGRYYCAATKGNSGAIAIIW